ncbi:aminoglycoside phosphotransferase family protein [Kitasatospora terrestris]|uniref:Streptomycin 6-kinase n=1 Tax=Kitasatospora terrestris TaxID=258051 RepID=A0ABP9DHP1_9ACTN
MTVELFPSSLPVASVLARKESGREWLARLPALVAELRDRWQLVLKEPYHGGSCSWVAPARLPDGRDAVLKVAWPHREAAGEAEALRLWDGRGAVRLLREDAANSAMLLELCEPGGTLDAARGIPAERRLLAGAELLDTLWRTPVPPHTALEPLAVVAGERAALAELRMARLRSATDGGPHGAQPVDAGLDGGLVAYGVRLMRELPASAARQVVLHGDFNPGNVVAARRRPWLAIDAKPLIGDPAYDPWPLIEQVDDPFDHGSSSRVLGRRLALVADTLGEQPQRLAAWAVARRVETALQAAARGELPAARAILGEARLLADHSER